MLAESWEISDDGLTYTFKIREAKFHDGSDLDSADVVYSMKKNADVAAQQADRAARERDER